MKLHLNAQICWKKEKRKLDMLCSLTTNVCRPTFKSRYITDRFSWWTANRPVNNPDSSLVGKKQKKVCLADSQSQFSQQTPHIELGQHCKAGYEL